MRRIVCLLVGVLLVVPSLGSDSPKDYDGTTEQDDLQGTWQLVGASLRCVMTNRGGTFSCEYSSGEKVGGSYRIDPAHSPPRLDWTPANGGYRGKRAFMIYQIDGDTLRVAGFPQ